jgi:hypothetical protein
MWTAKLQVGGRVDLLRIYYSASKCTVVIVDGASLATDFLKRSFFFAWMNAECIKEIVLNVGARLL